LAIKESDMKKTIFLIVFIFVYPALSFGASVSGHWKDTNHDGVKDTYVQPYERSSPNSSRTDNYLYPGNYNPNTGHTNPQSDSPEQNYPTNPNPYEHKSNQNTLWK
jgi:hypothetical protein